MDPIQNNGMSNYAMTAPQQQNDMQVPQDDYSSMPMVSFGILYPSGI